MVKRYILISGIVVVIIGLLVWGAATTSNSGTSGNPDNTKTAVQNGNDTSKDQKSGSGPTVINGSDSKNTSPDSNKDSGNNNNNSSKTDDKNTSNASGSGSTTAVNNSTPEEYVEYVVKKADSLSSIVKQYSNVCPSTVLSKAILDTNKLASSKDIKEGLKIKIPKKYVEAGAKYTVVKGDSLYTIASSQMKDTEVYKAMDILRKDNFLTGDVIKIGEELFISGASTASGEDSKAANSTSTSDDQSLSGSTGTSVNSGSSSSENSVQTVTYTVKKGETLNTIAKQYSETCPVTIASKTILKINNMTSSDSIKEGTVLKLPEEYLKSGSKYVVAQGDTLSKLAVEYIKDENMLDGVDRLKKINFIDSTSIIVGEELFITEAALIF